MKKHLVLELMEKKRDWMGVHGEADGDEDDDDSVGKAWFIDFKKM